MTLTNSRRAVLLALCDAANKLRQRRELSRADKSLATASVQGSENLDEQALFAQTLGLLRWEQGRGDEAAAHLVAARSLAIQGGAGDTTLEREAHLSALLLGLLLAEAAKTGSACILLHEDLFHGLELPGRIPEDLASFLRARAAFSYSFLVPDPRAASLALQNAMTLMSRVRDACDLTLLYRFEARAKARLGAIDEAVLLLEGLRRHHRERRDLPELAQTLLDLAALHSVTATEALPDHLFKDLESFSGARDIVSEAFRQVQEMDDSDPWHSLSEASWTLLNAFRNAGIYPAPLKI